MSSTLSKEPHLEAQLGNEAEFALDAELTYYHKGKMVTCVGQDHNAQQHIMGCAANRTVNGL